MNQTDDPVRSLAHTIITHITPVIIVKNGEQYVARALDALKVFKQVVLYDNGSTDSTLEVAGLYANVKIITGSFIGFGPTKNLAATYSDTNWILSMDIDECPDQRLLDTLAAWPVDNPRRVGVLLRQNLFCGKVIRTNGWGNDWLGRLYHRQYHTFTKSAVHERLDVNNASSLQRMDGSLLHLAVTDIAQMLAKAQHYSELYAESDKAKLYPFGVIVLKTFFGFFRSYVLRRGVLSGTRGFIIAYGEAMGVFFKYAKVYQRKKLNR